MGNYVKTIVDRTTSGMDKCVRTGELYDFVELVNAQLMAEERGEENSGIGQDHNEDQRIKGGLNFEFND